MEIDIDDGIDDDDSDVDDDDNDVDVVEAGELGTVTATADLYDERLGDTIGCDPVGCTAALTRVCMSFHLMIVPSFGTVCCVLGAKVFLWCVVMPTITVCASTIVSTFHVHFPRTLAT